MDNDGYNYSKIYLHHLDYRKQHSHKNAAVRVLIVSDIKCDKTEIEPTGFYLLLSSVVRSSATRR